jgi:hypothetical protein
MTTTTHSTLGPSIASRSDERTATEDATGAAPVSGGEGWDPDAGGVWRHGDWWIASDEANPMLFHVANDRGLAFTGRVPPAEPNGFRELVALIDWHLEDVTFNYRGLEESYDHAAELAEDAWEERTASATESGAPRVVGIADFAAIDEPGAEPVVGDTDNALFVKGGDAMVYGDGGAGKTRS